MTLHPLLKDVLAHITTLEEIDLRLKVLDLILKIETEFSFEYFAEMIKDEWRR